MNEKCKKCGAALTGGRLSLDDVPSMLTFACGSSVFADGTRVDGHCCQAGQIASLKIECEAWREGAERDRAEIAALKADLAKYTGPLTDEQAQRAWDIWDGSGAAGAGSMKARDTAIRAAREGAGK